MRSGANLKIDVGLGNAEVIEKNPRHPLIIVLTGMGVDRYGLDVD
jgi:hypothetical protein